MKDQNSLNTPTAEMLADAWRKHYAFGTWHWHDGQWVWLSPNGNGYSRCGSPVPPPAPDKIKPYHQLRWSRCKVCNAIKPWGGCGSKSISTYNNTWPGGNR
ncbi:MAG: hypothetical protein OXI63_01850 [Candidatus Poribacteria bacterium]|nr:hypothetical protein [Candidatus Poribacteria bacterium]